MIDDYGINYCANTIFIYDDEFSDNVIEDFDSKKEHYQFIFNFMNKHFNNDVLVQKQLDQISILFGISHSLISENPLMLKIYPSDSLKLKKSKINFPKKDTVYINIPNVNGLQPSIIVLNKIKSTYPVVILYDLAEDYNAQSNISYYKNFFTKDENYANIIIEGIDVSDSLKIKTKLVKVFSDFEKEKSLIINFHYIVDAQLIVEMVNNEYDSANLYLLEEDYEVIPESFKIKLKENKTKYQGSFNGNFYDAKNKNSLKIRNAEFFCKKYD